MEVLFDKDFRNKVASININNTSSKANGDSGHSNNYNNADYNYLL